MPTEDDDKRWTALRSLGLRLHVTSRGADGAIRFPVNLGCLLWLTVPVFLAVTLVAWWFSLGPVGICVLGALALSAAAALCALNRSWWMPFAVRINFDTGELSIPDNYPGTQRQFDRADIQTVGVEWYRNHGEWAPPDAEIGYLVGSLRQTRGDLHLHFGIPLGNLAPTQRRQFAVWFYQHVAPSTAVRHPLDPSPQPSKQAN